MKYAMIKDMRLESKNKYFVPFICEIFGVSASGYYAWIDCPLSERALSDLRLEVEIKAAHKRNRETFGPERLHHDLIGYGVKATVYRIKRIRKKLGIKCIQRKKFKATTDSNHTLPSAKNLLGQKFEAEAPNKVWVTDITYISTGEG